MNSSNTPAQRSRERIPIHRSFRRLALPEYRVLVVLLLPLCFNIATWYWKDYFAKGWAIFFEFWLERLVLSEGVVQRSLYFSGWHYSLPYIELPSKAPDSTTWWAALVVSLVLGLQSFFIADRLLPLRYFLRLLLVIQFSAQAYFFATPADFPYTIGEYFEGSMVILFILIHVIPWLHGLTYYIFDFPFSRKVGLTLLTLLFVVLFPSFQLVLSSVLLYKFSLLFMPVLQLCFGMFWVILGYVALYGWAMSWKRGSSRER